MILCCSNFLHVVNIVLNVHEKEDINLHFLLNHPEIAWSYWQGRLLIQLNDYLYNHLLEICQSLEPP